MPVLTSHVYQWLTQWFYEVGTILLLSPFYLQKETCAYEPEHWDNALPAGYVIHTQHSRHLPLMSILPHFPGAVKPFTYFMRLI